MKHWQRLIRDEMLRCWAQVSDALVDKVHDCYHLPATLGSDHVPLGIVLRQ